jgi:XFP-like protein
MDAWWRAANYLSVGQIYLLDNPLLREPLRLEQVKPRLLGHWGTTPGRRPAHPRSATTPPTSATGSGPALPQRPRPPPTPNAGSPPDRVGGGGDQSGSPSASESITQSAPLALSSSAV